MKKILSVYDSDVFYVTRFMEYFKNKKEFDIEISAFTKKESLAAYLELHKIDVLLLGETISPEELPKKNIKYIYQLREEREKEQGREQPSVFKYQSAQAVMAELLADYSKRLDELQANNQGRAMKILSIFSPRTSNTKISFAWALGFLLSKQKKVLFVPFELISVPFLSFLDNNKQAISEFIYYLKENQNIILKMKSLLSYNGNLSYLSGIAHGFDLLALNKEDIDRWVEELRLHTDYQAVVFYLGYYNDSATELIKLSDTIMIMNDETTYEKAYLREWEGQMDRLGVSISQDKFQKVNVAQEDNEIEGYPSLQEFSQSQGWKEALHYINQL